MNKCPKFLKLTTKSNPSHPKRQTKPNYFLIVITNGLLNINTSQSFLSYICIFQNGIVFSYSMWSQKDGIDHLQLSD